MKYKKYEIKPKRYTYTTSGYDKDTIETHWGVSFIVEYKNKEYEFSSEDKAKRFISLHTKEGKNTFKQIKNIENMIKKLEKQFEKQRDKLSSKKEVLYQKLEN